MCTPPWVRGGFLSDLGGFSIRLYSERILMYPDVFRVYFVGYCILSVSCVFLSYPPYFGWDTLGYNVFCVFWSYPVHFPEYAGIHAGYSTIHEKACILPRTSGYITDFRIQSGYTFTTHVSCFLPQNTNRIHHGACIPTFPSCSWLKLARLLLRHALLLDKHLLHCSTPRMHRLALARPLLRHALLLDELPVRSARAATHAS